MCIGTVVAANEPTNEGIRDGISDGSNDGKLGIDNREWYNYENQYNGWSNAEYESGYRRGYAYGYQINYEEPCAAPKEKTKNTLSSPAFGIGFRYQNGTITQRGDNVPTLYTWAEKNNKYEHHTTLTLPTEGTHTGCVIITPPQIAGEPMVQTNFWNTAKGQRILQWKSNIAY